MEAAEQRPNEAGPMAVVPPQVTSKHKLINILFQPTLSRCISYAQFTQTHTHTLCSNVDVSVLSSFTETRGDRPYLVEVSL